MKKALKTQKPKAVKKPASKGKVTKYSSIGVTTGGDTTDFPHLRNSGKYLTMEQTGSFLKVANDKGEEEYIPLATIENIRAQVA